MYKRPKLIYICTPLKIEKFKLDLISKMLLDENIFAFIPPTEQLHGKDIGARLDEQHIALCDELWAFGNLGRDCSWEIGYAAGLGKPRKVFLTGDNNYLRDSDWMVPLGVEFIEV